MTDASSTEANDDSEQIPTGLRVGYAVLLVAVVVVGWAPRLLWGLKLDETFSAWQAEGGWALARTKLGNPGQSILFGYIEALFYFPHAPHMELWLRVPAGMGALVCAYFVHRLAESFVGRGAGPVALLPFLANPYVVALACEARPYTLATAACLSTLWSLRQWLDHGRRVDRARFSVSLALVPHLHLMYVPFVFVPAMLVMQYRRRGRRVDWRGLAAALALSALLVAPLLPFLRDFARRRGGLSYLPVPGWARLFDVLTPGTVLLSLLGLAPLLVLFGRRRVRAAVDVDDSKSMLALAASWWLLPTLSLFVASRAAGQTVLIERYLLHTVVAQALVVAILYRRAPAPLARVALLLCLLPVPIVLAAQDWARVDGAASTRAPFRAARAFDPTGAAPLFVCSGHPLSNQADWRDGPEQGSFLYSQLTAYPVPNRVYPLPFALDQAGKEYVRAAADGALRNAALVLFVGEPPSETTVWLRTFFVTRGYAASFPVREGFGLLVLRRPNVE
jgi:hypothetical protein